MKKKTKIGNLFCIGRGGSPRPIKDFITNDANGLNWVKIGDVAEGAKFLESTKEKIKPEGLSKTRKIKPGDLILSNSMSFGRPYVSKIHGCIHDGWIKLIPKNNRTLTVDYFYYLLSLPYVQRNFAKFASGSVVNNLNLSIVRNTEVFVHSPQEQKLIAEILDQVRVLREKRQRAFSLLDKLKRSIFMNMFGDPILNLKNWPIAKLGELTSKIGSGATPRGGEVVYKVSGIPFIRSKNVRDGFFLDKNLAYINDEQAKALDNVIVQASDVLLNMTGASVARACRVPDKLNGARVNQSVAIIRPTEKLNSRFLEHQLLATTFKAHLLGIASGSSRKALTKSKIENTTVIIPPIKLQKAFSGKISSINTIEIKSMINEAKLKELFISFQRQIFSED